MSFDKSRLQKINPAMQRYVDRGTYAGALALVAQRGEIAFEGVYGHRDREAGAPMTPDTIFRLYSMTKPIVSTALMLLVEEAKLRLVDPLAAYIPAFGAVKVRGPHGDLVAPRRPIFVRDLLTHTSGLTYGFLADSPVAKDLYARAKLPDAHATLKDAIDELATMPLAYHPGERYHYSVGIDVAARLIEIVSGQSLGAFLRERLLEPLKMHDTDFVVPPAKRDRVAAMYGRPDIFSGLVQTEAVNLWRGGYNERLDVSQTYPVDAPGTFERGGHGLFGTIGDYHRFAEMLRAGGALDGVRIVGRKTLELMHANHLPMSMLPIEIGGLPLLGYGFGLGSRVLLDPAASGVPGSAGEFGWAGAAKTHYWVDPREEIVALFFTQSMSSFDAPELDLRALVYAALD